MIPTTKICWLRLRSNQEVKYWNARSALAIASAALLMGVAAAPVAQAQFSTLYSFSGSDGANPQSVLITDTPGNLYGTTANGGSGNYGIVFKLGTSGLTTLNAFSTTNTSAGLSPQAGLVMDGSGNLYGTTANGGTNSCGTVFKIAGATLQTLYSFGCSTDGANPQAALTLDPTGTILYGTTAYGGLNPRLSGFGTVFTISTSGTGFQTLYTFTGADGANSTGTLILDSAGNLYGTTAYGGSYQAGNVFELTPPPQGSPQWSITQLYVFAGTTDGANPYAGVTPLLDANGNITALFGTTVYGGSSASLGSIFKLTPPSASGAWTKTILWAFTGGADGAKPYGGLILDPAGNLDGTTKLGGLTSSGAVGAGTVFSLSPSSSAPTGYSLTTLHTFSVSDGANPYAGLYRDSLGNLYGTTLNGGSPSSGVASGTVFKIAAQTPQTIIQGLINSVNGMSGNPLNSGGVTSLVQHLQHAYRLVYSGNYSGAIVKLQAFINEVQGLEGAGLLTSDQAASLINPAQNAINLLTAMP